MTQKRKSPLGTESQTDNMGPIQGALKYIVFLQADIRLCIYFFMYVCAILIYWSISVRVYIAVQSDFLPSVNADASEGYSILPKCSPYILIACLWLDPKFCSTELLSLSLNYSTIKHVITLTNSIGLTPPPDEDSRSTGEDILRHLWNLKVHHSIQISPPIVSTLS
jgi:hypothetical protein